MSNAQVGNVYQQIISDVIDSSRVDFEEGGVDETVLEHLRTVRLTLLFCLESGSMVGFFCFHQYNFRSLLSFLAFAYWTVFIVEVGCCVVMCVFLVAGVGCGLLLPIRILRTLASFRGWEALSIWFYTQPNLSLRKIQSETLVRFRERI